MELLPVLLNIVHFKHINSSPLELSLFGISYFIFFIFFILFIAGV